MSDEFRSTDRHLSLAWKLIVARHQYDSPDTAPSVALADEDEHGPADPDQLDASLLVCATNLLKLLAYERDQPAEETAHEVHMLMGLDRMTRIPDQP